MFIALMGNAQQKNKFAKIAVADEVALSGAVLNSAELKLEKKNTDILFYGKVLSESNKLFWKSKVENNIGTFVLKRSQNKTDYFKVCEITAIGNDTIGAFYAYEDVYANGQNCFYQLASINSNLKEVAVHEVLINRKQAVLEKIVLDFDYINKDFSLNLTPDFGTQAKLLIYNIVGDIIYQNTYFLFVGNNEVSFNLSDFPFGAYYLKMYFDGIVYTKKIMKEN